MRYMCLLVFAALSLVSVKSVAFYTESEMVDYLTNGSTRRWKMLESESEKMVSESSKTWRVFTFYKNGKTLHIEKYRERSQPQTENVKWKLQADNNAGWVIILERAIVLRDGWAPLRGLTITLEHPQKSVAGIKMSWRYTSPDKVERQTHMLTSEN